MVDGFTSSNSVFGLRLRRGRTAYPGGLGNSATKADLFRSGLESSPVCECGVDETRAHYWQKCSQYAKERDELHSRVCYALKEHIILSVRILLGFSHKREEVNYEIRRAVVEFLQNTGRFKPQESV